MNKLERKQKRQRRLDLALTLARLEKEHCKPCDRKLGGKQNPENMCGKCPIYKQIRAIGVEMMGGEVIKPGKKGRKPLDISVEAYNDLKATGLKDELIAKKLNISLKSLANFKRTNGLAIKRNVSKDKLEGDNDTLEGVEVKQMVDSYFETRKAKTDELKESASPQLETTTRINNLEERLLESQSEIHRLSALNESLRTQNDKLRDYELDYRNLEADYLNGQNENKRLLEMLEKLKRTAEINVWLMEQHVGFMNQVEKNEEAREFVWR